MDGGAPENENETPGILRRSRDRIGRGTREFVRTWPYPHETHPAVVPGVLVDDQEIRYRIDRPITFTVGALIIAFLIWGVTRPDQVFDVSSVALNWVMVNLGWIFPSLAVGLLIFLLVIAVSKDGGIPLGLEDDNPRTRPSRGRRCLSPPFAAGFDSAADEVTEWYQYTDEDGNPVNFDYETNQYIDEEDPTRPDTDS